MEQANARAGGVNGEVLQVDGAAVADGAVPVVNGAVLPQMRGGAGQAAAPVVGALVAPVVGALVAPVGGPLFPRGHSIMDGVLLGPPPRKSNESYKILPKIADETWP